MNDFTHNKVAAAVVLNLLLPGVGYIYLKAKRRLWIAIPVALWALYQVAFVCFVFFTGSHYSYDQNLSPFTSTGMIHLNVYNWLTFFVMTVDTFTLPKGNKKQHA